MKILALPYTHTLSHLSRPLAVALELRAMGHEVVFAGESARASFITGQGFDLLPCHEPDPALLFNNIRTGKMRFVDDAEIERMIAADLAVIDSCRPDLVLTDGRFSAALSTHVARVPHAAIVNVSSTQYRALPYVPFFTWLPEALVGRDSSLWKSLDRVNLALEMALFDRVMNVFLRLSRKYGVKRTVTATNCLEGKDITFLADIEEYFPTRGLPESHHYVGPLALKTNLAPPAWWPLPKEGGPLVYITMGTTGVPEFFPTLDRVLRGAPFTAVITTGGQAETPPSTPGKVYWEKYLDGDLITGACDLVVCHGGNGTIYQALSHGKPILGIPTIPDQKFNMRRVEALGVGTTLDIDQFLRRPESLLERVREVTGHPGYRENARRLEGVLAGYHAARTCASIIGRAERA